MATGAREGYDAQQEPQGKHPSRTATRAAASWERREGEE